VREREREGERGLFRVDDHAAPRASSVVIFWRYRMSYFGLPTLTNSVVPQSLHKNMYTHKYVCIHIYIYVYVYGYIYTYTYI